MESLIDPICAEEDLPGVITFSTRSDKSAVSTTGYPSHDPRSASLTLRKRSAGVKGSSRELGQA